MVSQHSNGTDLIKVLRDKDTGMTKGFGFVTMQDVESTRRILAQSVHIVGMLN